MSGGRAAGEGCRPGFPAALLLLLFLLFWDTYFSAFPVMAAAAPSERHFLLTGEDEENGFHYEAEGVGAISSSLREGETAAVALITADPGCTLELFRNGERQQFENGDLIYETGAYELRVSPTGAADEIFAGFSFTIENEFGEIEAEAGRATVEENPELILSYNGASGMYRYQFPDGSWWEMNVPSGGIIGRPAVIRMSEGCSVFTVQKDGEEELPPEDLVFEEEGRYRMEVVSVKGGSGGREASIYKFKLHFTVGTNYINQMTLLNAPSGFSIRFADLEGRRAESDGKTYLRLREDGRYRILFMPDAESGDSRIRWRREAGEECSADYGLEFFRDTTPPYLVFSRPVNRRRIRGTVSCTASEEDCALSVKYNGTPVPDAKSPFSFGGSYEVTVCDQAGNGRTYIFYIENYYMLMDDRWIILSAALLLAAAAYMAYRRRNMRIL